MDGYLTSPERVRRFRPGTAVEATAALPDYLAGLRGEVIYLRTEGRPAVIVKWHAHGCAQLPRWWRGQPHIDKYWPEQLKLAEGEEWDEDSSFPALPEPPEELPEQMMLGVDPSTGEIIGGAI